MTEDEAKTKLCFRAATFGASQQLADGPGPNCIASACMAWRWVGSHINDPDRPAGDLIWSGRSYGHCGLAGDVEPTKASSLEYRRSHPLPADGFGHGNGSQKGKEG